MNNLINVTRTLENLLQRVAVDYMGEDLSKINEMTVCYSHYNKSVEFTLRYKESRYESMSLDDSFEGVYTLPEEDYFKFGFKLTDTELPLIISNCFRSHIRVPTWISFQTSKDIRQLFSLLQSTESLNFEFMRHIRYHDFY